MSKRQPSRARSDEEPYRVADLMVIFGYRDEDSFRGYRKRAEAMGFPKPLPGSTRPLKWSREQIDAWRAVGGRPAEIALRRQQQHEGEDAAAAVDELAIARARMHAKNAARG